MNKNKIYAGIIALAGLFMLSSCLSDESSITGGQNESQGPAFVTFRLAGNFSPSATRATSASNGTVDDLPNENTIDDLYAVVFKGGKFYRLIQTALKSGATDIYQFDMGGAGSYTMYLLANPANDLVNASTGKIVGIGANGDADDFFKLIADQTPGDHQSATHFLMTSAAVNVPIQASSQTGTDLTGTPIDLTRAAARIDIDARNLATSAQTFTIKDVIVHNRYPKTVINRGTETDMTLPANVKTTAQAAYTYTSIGTTGGEDVSDFTSAAEPAAGVADPHTLVRGDHVWDALIYTYENKTTVTAASEIADPATAISNGITVVEVVGDMNGVEVRQNVMFAYVDDTDDSKAHEISIDRNHLYSIVLSLKDVPTEYAPFAATINVLDWKTGETVIYTAADLADQTSIPDFEVTSAAGGTLQQSGATMTATDNASTLLVDESILNPDAIINVPNTGGTITLRVVSTQTSARLVFAEAAGETTEGLTVTCTSKSVDNTTDPNKVPYYIQLYSIVIGDNSTAGNAARNYTFRVENGLAVSKKREFTITQYGN